MVATRCVAAPDFAPSSETGHLLDMTPFTTRHRFFHEQEGQQACRWLEDGKILFFPTSPFGLAAQDAEVLLRQRQSRRGWHKNIAYRPIEDRTTGFDDKHADAGRLHEVLRSFSRGTLEFVGRLLPQYARTWRLDYASLRAVEEQGRKLRLHARNDLIHVDSFPKRPTHGDRILRIFMNINPHADRHWITGQPLDVLAREMGAEFAHQFVRRERPGSWHRLGTKLGFRLRPFSAYDQAMRRMHQLMKESEAFQRTCRKYHSHFPPGSAWLVFTDAVPHAVVSGQYALEQTVIVPRSAMLSPEKAPAAVLERFGVSV